MEQLWLVVFGLLIAKTHGCIFSEHLAKYLNYSVDPCDDFYDHVCSATPEYEVFKEKSVRVLREKVTSFMSNEIPSFLAEHKDILDKRESRALSKLQQLDAFFKYVETEEFQKTQNVFKQMFNIWKKIILKDFMAAPWTSRYSTHMDRLKNAELFLYGESHFNFTEKVSNLLKNLKICTNNFNTTTELRACATLETCSFFDEFRKLGPFHQLLFSSIYTVNGMNNGSTIHVFPAFYAVDYEDYKYAPGSIYMMFGHEIGHSFFYPERRNHPTQATPSNSQCFKEQMADSCALFYGQEYRPCKSTGNGKTFGEDACDWVGMRTVTSVAKEMELYFPDEAHDMWKRIFYSDAIRRCEQNTTRGIGEHSHPKVRINGIFRLFPEFAKTFNCKKGDRMVKEETCDPFTGPGAPLTKRRSG